MLVLLLVGWLVVELSFDSAVVDFSCDVGWISCGYLVDQRLRDGS